MQVQRSKFRRPHRQPALTMQGLVSWNSSTCAQTQHGRWQAAGGRAGSRTAAPVHSLIAHQNQQGTRPQRSLAAGPAGHCAHQHVAPSGARPAQRIAAAPQQGTRQQGQVGQGHQAQPQLLGLAGRSHAQETALALGSLAESTGRRSSSRARCCVGGGVRHPALPLLSLDPAAGMQEEVEEMEQPNGQ